MGARDGLGGRDDLHGLGLGGGRRGGGSTRTGLPRGEAESGAGDRAEENERTDRAAEARPGGE
jgi:hypothetical protein